MKKIIFILAILLIVVNIFSQESVVSGGLGVNVKNDWVNMTVTNSGSDNKQEIYLPSIGFNAFLDVTYLIIDAGISFSLDGNYREELNGTKISDGTIDDRLTYWNIQVLGKYPFSLRSVQLYPLAGLEYRGLLAAEDKNGNDIMKNVGDDYKSRLYLNIGIGADVMVGDSFFIRPIALFGYKILHKEERDLMDTMPSGSDMDIHTFTLTTCIYAGFRF